jgi:hypothetical protein
MGIICRKRGLREQVRNVKKVENLGFVSLQEFVEYQKDC